MKPFQRPELKQILYSVRDILTMSPQSVTTEAPTEKTTDKDGAIITPPDEFDDGD